MVYQLVGNCGVGKTWIMLQLLQEGSYKPYKYGLFRFMRDGNKVIVGKYDGSTFQGSDKLAMNIASQFTQFKKVITDNNWNVLVEGDRFMNTTFRNVFNPTVIKITGDGSQGRSMRGTDQSPQHLKRINTRVTNYNSNITVTNSNAALDYLKKIWNESN